jgi:hypothetical protein
MNASIILKHGCKWDVRIDLQEGFILDGIYMFLAGGDSSRDPRTHGCDRDRIRGTEVEDAAERASVLSHVMSPHLPLLSLHF